ncbi:Zn2/Cys6 DNA-binding protein [Glarea lozoyensis ATCC 20868]|uniref:Zn2/Cys6 DNA-binding protein n=1 Tax=Glarea lozoyensis (strain ATCC 20868 / MF5171) TaxID=1116229 RepID=S3CXF1_GLAL2|nr:Zn2/Cys6 DNA-binding protein [Glarea lozoyensis ATCC 20868]EPE24511.1 Zn2/Cys6 DNA-binding protein [Glarea lozoyensis ATCC 20868]
MVGNAITCKRRKVKTGCATCRIRRVKCDEAKPFCQKCVNTGRTCDGYESPFRVLTRETINGGNTAEIKLVSGLQPVRSTFAQTTPREIDLLNRYFSIKTIFDVELGCDQEARRILEASLVEPSLKHAVSSLKALREDLETTGDWPASFAQQTPSHNNGLRQYNLALVGLASKLSSLGPDSLDSALLCCQVFISIEQVRKNYSAMAQHIIQGLRIMHEYRARPYLDADNNIASAHHRKVPLLDVFVIKIFAAPCKFAQAPPDVDTSESALSLDRNSPRIQHFEARNLRTIAPNMRSELTRIATLTLEFLDQVSRVESTTDALQLLTEREVLLNSLKSWLFDLEMNHTHGFHDLEPIPVCFLRLFHTILKIALLGALQFSPDTHTALSTEYTQLQTLANKVNERLRTYTTSYWNNAGRK